MHLLRIAALLSITLLLGACATPMRVSLTPEQRGKITELTAHVVVVQDEVIAAVQPSNVSVATGGGLIGAMVDSHITNNRVKESQQTLGPFYAAIEDIDYRKEFNEAIRRELAGYQIKVGHLTTTPRALTNDALAKMRAQLAPSQALLVVYPRYFLTMDFRNLDAESVVTMWTKPDPNAAGTSATSPIQRGVLYYQSQGVGSGGKESVALWSAQNAALFRTVLRESITETLRMILLDMDVAAAPTAKAEELKAFPFNTGGGQSEVKGQLLKDGASRAVLLGTDQKLYSLPKAAGTATAAKQ
jgi:hypothetical protein